MVLAAPRGQDPVAAHHARGTLPFPAADDRADLWEIMTTRLQTREALAATATADS